jgi:hypothetical protein
MIVKKIRDRQDLGDDFGAGHGLIPAGILEHGGHQGGPSGLGHRFVYRQRLARAAERAFDVRWRYRLALVGSGSQALFLRITMHTQFRRQCVQTGKASVNHCGRGEAELAGIDGILIRIRIRRGIANSGAYIGGHRVLELGHRRDLFGVAPVDERGDFRVFRLQLGGLRRLFRGTFPRGCHRSQSQLPPSLLRVRCRALRSQPRKLGFALPLLFGREALLPFFLRERPLLLSFFRQRSPGVGPTLVLESMQPAENRARLVNIPKKRKKRKTTKRLRNM